MTLVERMQELLEAERTGLVCFDQMAFFASHKEINHFFMSARNESAVFCEGLHSLILQREARPTDAMGGFAEKVMALETEKERIDLIAKEMAWVVRKIEEIPRTELNEGEVEFFDRMRNVYNNNLQICNSYQE